MLGHLSSYQNFKILRSRLTQQIFPSPSFLSRQLKIQILETLLPLLQSSSVVPLFQDHILSLQSNPQQLTLEKLILSQL